MSYAPNSAAPSQPPPEPSSTRRDTARAGPDHRPHTLQGQHTLSAARSCTTMLYQVFIVAGSHGHSLSYLASCRTLPAPNSLSPKAAPHWKDPVQWQVPSNGIALPRPKFMPHNHLSFSHTTAWHVTLHIRGSPAIPCCTSHGRRLSGQGPASRRASSDLSCLRRPAIQHSVPTPAFRCCATRPA